MYMCLALPGPPSHIVGGGGHYMPSRPHSVWSGVVWDMPNNSKKDESLKTVVQWSFPCSHRSTAARVNTLTTWEAQSQLHVVGQMPSITPSITIVVYNMEGTSCTIHTSLQYNTTIVFRIFKRLAKNWCMAGCFWPQLLVLSKNAPLSCTNSTSTLHKLKSPLFGLPIWQAIDNKECPLCYKNNPNAGSLHTLVHV